MYNNFMAYLTLLLNIHSSVSLILNALHYFVKLIPIKTIIILVTTFATPPVRMLRTNKLYLWHTFPKKWRHVTVPQRQVSPAPGLRYHDACEQIAYVRPHIRKTAQTDRTRPHAGKHNSSRPRARPHAVKCIQYMQLYTYIYICGPGPWSRAR